MNQQDNTAPQYPVRQSGKEPYRDVFQLMQADGLTPDTSLKGAVVAADLYVDKGQQRIDQGRCTWVSDHAVQVEFTAPQLAKLRGRYRAEVYVTTTERSTVIREDLVHILLELV